MPVLIIALLIIAALILMRYRPAAGASKGCDWRRKGQKGTLFEFHCATCKQTAYSQSPSGPSGCKKHLRNSL